MQTPTINDGPALYRTKDGRLVEAGERGALFLVAGAGAAIQASDAAEVAAYRAAQAEGAKQDQPAAEDKRKRPATENKGKP